MLTNARVELWQNDIFLMNVKQLYHVKDYATNIQKLKLQKMSIIYVPRITIRRVTNI